MRFKLSNWNTKDLEESIASFLDSGMRLVEEIILSPEEYAESYAKMYKKIETRGLEQMKRHPGQHAMFEAYFKTQREENEFLESADACGVFLLQGKTSV